MKTVEIITLAEAYRAHRGVTLSTVSTWVANDGKRLAHLKDGGGCTVKTYLRCVQWFADNWPADLEWPREIARPAKTKKDAA
jgi:hypothetical protein